MNIITFDDFSLEQKKKFEEKMELIVNSTPFLKSEMIAQLAEIAIAIYKNVEDLDKIIFCEDSVGNKRMRNATEMREIRLCMENEIDINLVSSFDEPNPNKMFLIRWAITNGYNIEPYVTLDEDKINIICRAFEDELNNKQILLIAQDGFSSNIMSKLEFLMYNGIIDENTFDFEHTESEAMLLSKIEKLEEEHNKLFEGTFSIIDEYKESDNDKEDFIDYSDLEDFVR